VEVAMLRFIYLFAWNWETASRRGNEGVAQHLKPENQGLDNTRKARFVVASIYIHSRQ